MGKLKDWYKRQSWLSLTFYGLTAASFIVPAGAYAIQRRRLAIARSVSRPLFVDFSGPIEFNPNRGVSLTQIGQPKKMSYFDIHKAIQFAAKDEKVPGIVIRVGRSMNMSWAQMSEFRSTLKKFKESSPDKEIVCFCESFDHLGTLFLSSIGDRVVMQPAGIVNLQGVSMGNLFFANALQRAEINAQVEKRHEYKGALNPLINEKYDDAQREVTECLVNGINEHVRKTIASDRGIEESKLDSAQSSGAITAAEAIELGLIDETAYLQDYVLGRSGKLGAHEQYLEHIKTNPQTKQDIAVEDIQLAAELEKTYGRTSLEVENDMIGITKTSTQGVVKYPVKKSPSKKLKVNVAPVWNVNSYLKKVSDMKQEKKLKKQGYVAIIHADGQINSGKSTRNGIYSETLSATLEKALEDKKVKAVVLRINSPGGDPVACDTITRSIQRLQAAKKPVVAQMSSVAASGGYWLASQCNSILAAPLTITGSIGVIAGNVSIGSFLRRYGVTKDSYTTHESSTPAMPWYDGLSESQRNILSRTIDSLYDHFVKKVSIMRDIDEEKAHESAKGRVWLGSEAKMTDLVDTADEQSCSPFSAVQLATSLAQEQNKDLKDFSGAGEVYPRPPKTLFERLTMAAEKNKKGQGVPFATSYEIIETSDDFLSKIETPLERLAMTGGRGPNADYQQLKLVSDVDTIEIGILEKLRSLVSRFFYNN